MFSPALHAFVALFSQFFIKERAKNKNFGKRLGICLGPVTDHCKVEIDHLIIQKSSSLTHLERNPFDFVAECLHQQLIIIAGVVPDLPHYCLLNSREKQA